MLKKLLLSLCLLATCNLTVFAQIQKLSTPLSFTKMQLSTDIPQVIMPAEEIDIPKLLAEDDRDMEENQPMRFAHRFDVSYHLENSGQWEILTNGDRIWRLTIWSPGAVNINLAYRKFKMPIGGQLHVYNSDHSQVIGAFTSKNNRPDGYFTTRLIHDDRATLEYYEPAAVRDQGVLEIMTVAHGYRHLDGRTAAEKAGDCQVNVNCAEGSGWVDQKKGIARILMDNAFLCSGTLINNAEQDCRPLFSTANHCVMGTGHDAASPNALAPLYTFYWNYECDCGTADDDCDPNDDITTAGATVIVSSGGSGQGVGGLEFEFGDFALLELSESPVEAGYDVYFNGWDRNGAPDGTGYLPQALTGIHHPAGDQKKISTDFPNTGPIGAINIGAPTTVEDGQYWQLFWEETANGFAVTEGGSSGSPLFDSQTQLFIGQLFGGSSENCANPALDRAVYGGLFYSWENDFNPTAAQLDTRRMSPHLDPNNTGAMTVPGKYPCNVTTFPTPFIAFTTLETAAVETAQTDVMNECLDYTDYIVGIRASRVPSADVPLTISITDTSTDDLDYQLMTPTLTLTDNTTNDIVIRIFDDFVVEVLEELVVEYDIDASNTSDAIRGTLNQSHAISIKDNDAAPETAGSATITLFSDDFSDQTTSETNWTVDVGILHRWRPGRTNTAASNAGMTEGCAFVSTSQATQYAYTTAPDDETMMSTQIDATMATDVSISFEWTSGGEGDATPYDFGTLVYSTDGGTTFETVPGSGIYKLSEGVAIAENIALPAAVNNSTFHIGFKWQHDNNAGDMVPMAVDNVVVSGTQSGVAPVAKAVTTVSASAYLSPHATVHFYDPSNNNVMATIINNDDFDFGCTTVEIDRAGSSAENYWSVGAEVTSKSFRVIPENAGTGKSLDVSLYYTKDEIEGWVANNTDMSAASSLEMIQGDQDIPSEDGVGVATQIPATVSYDTDDFKYTATFTTPATAQYGYALGQVVLADPLAVELVDLKASTIDNAIVLNWTTLIENNNVGFTILRSSKPTVGFAKIGWVASSGTSRQAQNYTYIDKGAKAGQRYYYQLQQVDESGQQQLSTVVHAKLSNAVEMSLSPNPVSNQLTVNLSSARTLSGSIRIVNLLGQEVHLAKFAPTQSLNKQIATTAFANGVYLVQIIVEGDIYAIQKFVKK